MKPNVLIASSRGLRDYRAPLRALKKLKYSTKAAILLLAVLLFIALLGDALEVEHSSATNNPLPSREETICSVRFKSNRMALCFFLAYGGNFGDELGPAAVDLVLKDRFHCTSNVLKLDVAQPKIDRQRRQQGIKCLFTLGSIFHSIQHGDHVWGTGVNPYWQEKYSYATGVQVYSVRGPKTEKLLRKNLGIQHSIPHGDPGFLVPLMDSEFATGTRAPGGDRFCFVPHFHDVEQARKSLPDGILSVSAAQPWRPVVKILAQECDYVASSSLHGIVVADALGIPSMWFQFHNTTTSITEGRFKYLDYLEAVGRNDIKVPVADTNQLRNKNAYTSILDIKNRKSIVNRTISSFPFHLFESKIVDLVST